MISKGPGTTKLRPLGIPVVRDRVAQEVIRRLLAPIFEPQFHDASFGFIPKRNCHQAIELLGQGGGKALAERFKLDLLGQIPWDPKLVEASNKGRPLDMGKEEDGASKAYGDLISQVLERTAERKI